MRANKNHALAVVLVLAACTAIAAAAPPSIVTKGDGAVAACASCHGVDGAGNAQAGFPALAQLAQTYLIKQIADFKSGARANAVMSPTAKALSDADAEAAAQYYARLVRQKTQPATQDPAIIARGENLAVNGAWERQMPPCFKCHAVDGLGVPPVFPLIAGQHAAYTVSQLQAWRTGARNNDPQHLMQTVAAKLTDDEILAVAAYLSALGTEGKKK